MKAIRPIAVAIVAAGVLMAAPAAAQEIDALLKTIKLPPGFEITLFARVPSARSLAVDPASGAIFVGSRSRAVHRIIDRDGDGFADEVARVTGALRVPNGLAIRNGKLFIAEQHRISFWAGTDDGGGPQALDPLTTIFAGLPDKSWHGWRYAGFGPDGKLYVLLGSPCNVCAPKGLEGSIIRIRPEGGAIEVVAHGVRNSVGFDWHPKTGELFLTDNGADRMGDDVPADELNHVTGAGQFFGFPYFGGGRTRTAQTQGQAVPSGARAPAIEFQAHVASLGMHFYRGNQFPGEYKGDAFVAQHGSWNRSSPVGYRVMRIRFNEKGKATGKQVFADGWLQGGKAWGRPVDIKMIKDGSILVSDDFLGAVYRISYVGAKQ
jgi:glucose/arabinose dehydrogenase